MVMRIFCINAFLLITAVVMTAAHGQARPEPSCPMPEWPNEARRYEIDGVTTVRYAVGADGKAVNAIVTQSAGWKILDNAALNNLARCTFPTPTVTSQQHPMQYNWTLRNGPRVRPLPLVGSCQSSPHFGEFIPGDKSASNANGIVLRMLVNSEGKPFGIYPERNGLATEVVRDAIAYIQTCRFAYSSDEVGERTDTLFGKLLIN